VKRVCFDIETFPFSNAFANAKSDDVRRQLAPELRVACIFEEHTNRYRYFTAEKADRLIKLLLEADEIISFNGKGFDLLVLQRHYRLSAIDCEIINNRHIDLCELFHQQNGYRLSLNALAWWNLKHGKKVSGRNMASLTLRPLKSACRSDVYQTYQLWKVYDQGKLQVPTRIDRKRDFQWVRRKLPFNICVFHNAPLTPDSVSEHLRCVVGLSRRQRMIVYVEAGSLTVGELWLSIPDIPTPSKVRQVLTRLKCELAATNGYVGIYDRGAKADQIEADIARTMARMPPPTEEHVTWHTRFSRGSLQDEVTRILTQNKAKWARRREAARKKVSVGPKAASSRVGST
jgi:hypothetical protein